MTDPVSGNLYVADQENHRVVELTAWGDFIKAWGWGVVDGASELQTCTAQTGCRKGLEGDGAGEFMPQGIARDSNGDVYLVDLRDHRVQKFDPGPDGGKAQFLRMWGKGVNSGTSGNPDLCTNAGPPTDVCGAGAIGTSNGQFGDWRVGSFIAAGPGNTVYVGDKERVQEFEPDGSFIKSIPLPGELVQSLAVDPTGHIYLAFFKSSLPIASKEGVVKLGVAGEVLCTAKVKNPRALATDDAGDLYVVDGQKTLVGELTIRRFDPDCSEDSGYAFTDSFTTSTGIAADTVTQNGESALYVSDFGNGEGGGSFLRAYLPAPDKPPPFRQAPEVAPTIASQFATAVDAEGASVRATINPHFWTDTSYYVEYGTGRCSEGGCVSTRPAWPGAKLGAGRVSEDARTPAVFLPGLQPGTTYHYRFVAQSPGGGPTFGTDPDGEGPEEATFASGGEGAFNTPYPSNPDTSCPNQVLRTGPSARLPDCRAYEIVSPLDKENGSITVLTGYLPSGYGFFPSRIDQAAPEGERVTYSSDRAFAGAESSPWSSQYISSRDPQAGWSTRSINPPLGTIQLVTESSTETPFQAFGEDLCSAWVRQLTELPLAAGSPAEVPNLYRRDICDEGGYELITSVAPPGYSRTEGVDTAGSSLYETFVQGSAENGANSFFRANAKLTSNACPTKGRRQLYESHDGGALALVSVLPNGKASCEPSSLGTSKVTQDFRSDNVHNAVSTDGSRVFWTTGAGTDDIIYLRANPLATKSAGGKCVEAGKACTLAISPPESVFWSADPGGSTVIYQTGKELFEANIADEGETLVSHSTRIAGEVQGTGADSGVVVGTSEDAQRVYFVSKEALSAEPNSVGAIAQAGSPNLYLYEKETGFRFIGVLSAVDSHSDMAIDSIKPGNRPARVSADGSHATFVSTAPLTGYDNTDLRSGEADTEVYLYDAEASNGKGRLLCISCNPSGARPTGRVIGELIGVGPYSVASRIPGWETQQHASRILSADGKRLFFESFDSLLPRDANGAKDVYEWEQAEGREQCEELGAEQFVPSAGGCLSLISSGESPANSEFIDASEDGRDVFFTTESSLLPQDPGLADLYDARAGGGFPPPPSPPAACEGEACQGAPEAPNDPTPASSSFNGAGNAGPAARKPRKKKHSKAKKRQAKVHRKRGLAQGARNRREAR